MALHDPVQDEINRQIRASLSARRTPQERELLRLPRTEDITNIPPEGVESVLERADRSLGRVFTTTVKGESARDKAFRLRKEEGLRRFLAEREAGRVRREDQQSTIRGKDALAQMREMQGRASLITANAALAKARTGAKGDRASADALRALGLDPALDISRVTARTVAEEKGKRERGRAAAEREKEKLEAQREKEKRIREDREKSLDLKQRAEARAQTKEQVESILRDQNVSEETRSKVSSIVNQALSKMQDEEVPPEVVEELFNEALGETFGDRKKAAALAKQRARERGYYVPE
jgi:hypothetical protein